MTSATLYPMPRDLSRNDLTRRAAVRMPLTIVAGGPAVATGAPTGAKLVKTYGFDRLPGVPIMNVLHSQAAMCHIGVHDDTAAVREPELFARCLRDGFDEVLALGRSRSSTKASARTSERAST